MTDNNNYSHYSDWCLTELNSIRSNPPRSNLPRSNPIGSNPIGSNSTRLNKWKPNEELYNEYNRLTEMMYKNKNMTTINDLKKKITHNKKLLKKFSKSTNQSDKFEALDIKLYISDLEIELLRQNNIENLKHISSKFFSEWLQYLDDATNFIKENDLYNVVKVKDILSNNNLKIVKKRNIDGFNNCVNNFDYSENIAQLNIHFDILG